MILTEYFRYTNVPHINVHIFLLKEHRILRETHNRNYNTIVTTVIEYKYNGKLQYRYCT